MQGPRPLAESVDDYISQYPETVQKTLAELRVLIKAIAPEAVESITYAIPTYKVNGKRMVYFAGFEKHVGVYPLPDQPDAELARDIAPFVAGKGTLRFPLNVPLPTELIKRVVQNRLECCL
jgi:uncharacterized protein YdhG (YjbR/CyaY superfamily)